MLAMNPRSTLSPSLFVDLVSSHLIDHLEPFHLKSMLRLALAAQSSLVVYLSTSYASLSRMGSAAQSSSYFSFSTHF